jgi:hypothetical protein
MLEGESSSANWLNTDDNQSLSSQFGALCRVEEGHLVCEVVTEQSRASRGSGLRHLRLRKAAE